MSELVKTMNSGRMKKVLNGIWISAQRGLWRGPPLYTRLFRANYFCDALSERAAFLRLYNIRRRKSVDAPLILILRNEGL
jgi:hypothetical protein